MTPAIDITDEQRRTVLALLNRHLPDTTTWACGSRVKWTSRPESDLDLVVFARPEQSAQVAELREAFEESNLPFQVDLFVWGEMLESFRKRIEDDHVVLTKDSPARTDNKRSRFYMRPKLSEAIPEFIVAYFKTPEGQHELLANASQVGVPSIARLVIYLRSIELPIPPIQEQRSIAHILGTLDDKIELNRRINETLETMARSLFKSWFVDFDPVRAKMEGRDTGLPKDIADLFPDQLVDSELGEIPAGWTVRHLKDCFEIIMGQSPPSHTYNDIGDGLPFFQGHSDFGFRYPGNRKFCTAPNRIAEPEDTLVSVRAPVGDINMAWERCCIGRGIASLRYRVCAASFTYYTVQALQVRLREYENTGTVFGAITRMQLARLPIQQPSMELVHAFECLARGWDETIRRNTAQINTLTALRSVLLPRLVSGHLWTRYPMRFTGRTI